VVVAYLELTFRHLVEGAVWGLAEIQTAHFRINFMNYSTCGNLMHHEELMIQILRPLNIGADVNVQFLAHLTNLWVSVSDCRAPSTMNHETRIAKKKNGDIPPFAWRDWIKLRSLSGQNSNRTLTKSKSAWANFLNEKTSHRRTYRTLYIQTGSEATPPIPRYPATNCHHFERY
jgi:hypothetical protein